MGIGQESNGAANQEKQIFLLCQISPSASSTRDLGTRLAEVVSVRLLLEVTCVIFARATNTDVWQAIVASATKSRENCSKPP